MAKSASKSKSAPVKNLVRLEYRTVIHAGPAVVWKKLLDLAGWKKFTDFYGELRWTQGKPWIKGSRLRMELLRPTRVVVSRVIIMSYPPEFIAWIDHSRSSTVEQWVSLIPEADGNTVVHVSSQIVGSQPKVANMPFAEFVQNNVKHWFEAFCKECDRLPAKS